MRIFYFGCRDEVGHFCWGIDQSTKCRYDEVCALIGGHLDGTLAPKVVGERQGAAALLTRNGFTVLAWWDRTVDHRHGSNSGLIVEGEHSFDEMLALLAYHFPDVAARQSVSVELLAGAGR